MFTGKPAHLKTFDYTGLHRYFLTFCTHQRRWLFVASTHVNGALTQIRRAGNEMGFDVFAYCFMPDHLHLLVTGNTDDADCRRFISRAKQYSGFHYQRTFGERLWQRYGYERTLRDEESTLSVARYILENPVRAKLTERVSDYPFAGSDVSEIGEILEAVQLRDRWWSG